MTIKNNCKDKRDSKKRSIILGGETNGSLIPLGSLGSLLKRVAESTKERGITFIEDRKNEKYVSYKNIYSKAKSVLAALQSSGVKPGRFAILCFKKNVDFVPVFWACILGGIIPVPVAFPSSLSRKSDAVTKLTKVVELLDDVCLISDSLVLDDELSSILNINSENVFDSKELLSKSKETDAIIADVKLDDIAFIQYSSGSTGNPKGVTLTHRNLLINLEGIIEGLDGKKDDTYLSWMPYHHDMGLIGFHLTPIAQMVSQVNILPFKFVQYPLMWMSKVNEHRATITSSPNFGYVRFLEKYASSKSEDWDLSCLRLIFNGAEPISAKVMERFMGVLAERRLKSSAMYPVYGMAEASLALSFPGIKEKPIVHTVDRQLLADKQKISIVTKDDPNALEVVDLGSAVPGVDIRVVSDKDRVLNEGRVGHIQIRGKNVTKGYYNNDDVNQESYVGKWLRTGDLGFINNSRLCVTGRAKDIIFVNGQNFFAYDIESCAETVSFVQGGKVAACGWTDPNTQQEQVALFVGVKIPRTEDVNEEDVLRNIGETVNEVMGFPINYIVPVKSVPKTTSGKIQRYRLLKELLVGKHESNVLHYHKQSSADDSANINENITGSIEEQIRKVWAIVLERPVDDIAVDIPFLKQGGSSIKAVKIMDMLESRFDLELGHEILLKCQTVKMMSDYIEHEQKANIDIKHSDEQIVIEKTAEPNQHMGDIAVISMACRFPKSTSADKFWQHIRNGADLVDEVPDDRWNINEFYDESNSKDGSTSSRWGAFIDEAYDFDAGFFGISDDEAKTMDPQQRLVLMLCREALDISGYTGADDNNKIGVFVGASFNNYMESFLQSLTLSQLREFESVSELEPEVRNKILEEWTNKFGSSEIQQYTVVDNLLNMIAARTSQELNLKGPSYTVDSACSSSLVSLHMACESIRRGECELALAGGVNLLLTPTPYQMFSRSGALSKTGRCMVFDANADGFVPGEGGGVVLLKPLKEAIDDGDIIHGVIKGSWINNDGRSIGVMSPNPDGQKLVIEDTYQKFGLNPDNISYVEAHGTGTVIGDHSEVRALRQAYSRFTKRREYCALGSVKANVGHLLSAAGIASFFKVLMALKYKQLPPSINITETNKSLGLDDSPFYLVRDLSEWKIQNGQTRQAAINSFGFGGTNCHLVLEEAPKTEINSVDEATLQSPDLICLSGRDQDAITRQAESLANYLESRQNYRLSDISYTMNVRRNHYEYRTSISAKNLPDLLNQLSELKNQDSFKGKKTPKIAFMFTGQGSQYTGMGSQLYQSNHRFKYFLDLVLNLIEGDIGIQVREAILNPTSNEQVLTDTKVSQPAIFAIDYALARLLVDYGINPDYVMGHSLGEYAAACVSGLISLEDAIKIIIARGRLMSELPAEGGMIAVFESENHVDAVVAEYLGHVSIAAYNGSHVVISGEQETLEQISKYYEGRGVTVKPLNVSHAFHSPLMEPMLDSFSKTLDTIDFQSPSIPIVSNTYAAVTKREQLDREYWLNHIISPVRFSESLHNIYSDEPLVCLEIGPKPVLEGMVKSVIGLEENVTVLSTLNPKIEDADAISQAVSKLYKAGINIDWSKLYKVPDCKLLSLPPYSFNQTSYRLVEPKTASVKTSAVKEEQITNFKHRIWTAIEQNNTQHSLPDGPVLIFANNNVDAEKLQSELDQGHDRVIIVREGNSFNRDESGNYTLNIQKQEDYAKLINELILQKTIPVAVLYLNMYKCDSDLANYTNEEQSLYKNLFGLFYLYTEWSSKLNNHLLSLTIVSNGIYSKDKNTHSLHQALSHMSTVWSASASTENLQVTCRTLDIADEGEISEIQIKYICRCLSELNQDGEYLLEGELLKKSYWQSHTKYNKDETSKTITSGDTLLITGGASGVGFELALSLAKRYKLNLVLTGRQLLPPKSEWGDSSNTRVSKLQQLRDAGAEVYYKNVNVTDYEAMNSLMTEVRQQFGQINGVIHAAGIVDKKHLLAAQKTRQSIELVLAPKVIGTLNLDKLTCKDDLKCFVNISSISSTEWKFGSGLSDYSAANAFLDRFTDYRISRGGIGRTLTLNWPLWQGYGMGKEDWVVNAVSQHGVANLSRKYALNIFHALLDEAEAGTYYIEGDLKQSEDSLHKEQKKRKVSSSNNRPVADSSKATNLKNTHVRNEYVIDIIRQHLAERLEISINDISITDNFVDIGVDSATAVEFTAQLGKTLNHTLYPTLLFEYQTPEALAVYIRENITSEEISEKDNSSTDKELDNEVQSSDVAIIGMACHLPGAKDTQQFWSNLYQGKSFIGEVPDDRWSKDSYFVDNSESQYKSYAKWGGFIDEPYDFDPMFFGISPKEAESIDPQQRLFLEVAWTALQNAGYVGENSTKHIGVYVGCEHNNYSERFIASQRIEVLRQKLSDPNSFANMDAGERENMFELLSQTLNPGEVSSDTVAGNGMNIVAARVSQCLDLTGPALAVNTACSSSLVALHMACDGLRNGDAKVAIAGGVSLNLSSTPFVLLSQAKALSPNGNCTPFDKNANGMVLGEGAGALILKPLSDALRDGDLVHAVIKGSAINNDGRSNGITAPKPDGQARVLQAAYEKSGVNPESISYIECHGTATSLGDPIEVQGMTQAFREFTDEEQFCAIGSVKSSIGHLLSASGVASVIKVANMLQKKTIPPTVGYKDNNPYIDFDNSPFYVANSLQPWLTGGKVRRAGISAFGFGGTNCHIVLEESPCTQLSKSEDQSLICLTGRSENVLKQNVNELLKYLEKNSDHNIRDISYSLLNGQRHFKHRLAIVASSTEELIKNLKHISDGNHGKECYFGVAPLNKEKKVKLSFSDKFECNYNCINILSEYFPEFESSVDAWLEEWEVEFGKPENTYRETFVMQYVFGRFLQALGINISTYVASFDFASTATKLKELHGDNGEIINSNSHNVNPNNTYNDNEFMLNIGKYDESNQCHYLFTGGQEEELVMNVLTMLANLYIQGVSLDWGKAIHDGHRVSLPGYVFERKTYKSSYKKKLNLDSNNIAINQERLGELIPLKHMKLSKEKRMLAHERLSAYLDKM